MALMEGDDLVQQIAPTTLDPSFRHAVLPGTSDRGPNGTDGRRAHCNGNLQTILAVPVQEKKSRSPLVGKASRNCCTIQLLVGCRVTLKCRMRRRS